MTVKITIIATCPWHLREMAETMSQDSTEVAGKMGLTPLKALWHSYRKSIVCKTALIDGRIAAIFGISGAVFCDTGRPWLILTPEVNEYPMRVAFIYRRVLNDFNKMFPILEEFVPENNEKSIRLLEIMGFKVSKNKFTVDNAVFVKAERRA